MGNKGPSHPNLVYWKKLKAKVIKERGNRCEKCLRDNCTLAGHHLTYKRYGRELAEDIQILCEACHNTLHGGKPPRGSAERKAWTEDRQKRRAGSRARRFLKSLANYEAAQGSTKAK